MPTALARSSPSWITLRRALFAFGALLVGINVGSALWDLRAQRALVERNALRDFSNLTALLAEQTAASLESVDLLLDAAVSNMRANGIGALAPREAVLKERISGLPQVRGVLLLGPDGRVLLDTEEQIPAGVDLSDRTYFAAHRDAVAGKHFVSEPFQGRTGHWEFAVSAAIGDRSGRFAGVLAVKMDVAYFDRLYRSLDISGGGFVGLMTRSGTPITYVPGPREAFGRMEPGPGGVLEALQRDGRFAGWSTSTVPGQDLTPVLISAAAIPNLALDVVVGTPERSALAPWRAEAVRIGVRTLLTSAAMLALILLAARELGRRAAADQRVHQSEERYALAMDASEEGHFDWDLPTDMLFASAKLSALFGLPAEAGHVFRREFVKHIPYPPGEREPLQASLEAVIKGSVLRHEFEHRIFAKSGEIRWLASRWKIQRDERARATRIVGVVMDVTERRQAAAELQRQKVMLDELIESAPEAIMMLDADWRAVQVNREFTRMFGYTADEAVGEDVGWRVVPEERLSEAQDARARLNRGEHVSRETVRKRKDGSLFHVSVLGAPIWVGGDRIGAFFIFRDITERKLAEAEQARLEARLRQSEKMEAVGRLAGGIAHDFNNILGGILGYGEMVFEEAAEGTPMKRYARNLLTGANRARDLVDQILAYSRSQHAKRTPVEFDRIARETLELVRGSLAEGIALALVLPESPLIVVADPTQLHQVVMNLCTNAIHAMGGSGTLRVVLEPVDVALERTLAHGVLAPGRYVRLTVADTGSGMDAATMGRIFEPFFTTKEVGRGTGLGLSLVYGIVTDSGGAIHIASELGRGSTFEIYLPRADARARVAEAAGEPVPRGNGERVLLVDDEQALIDMTAEVLAQLGYEAAAYTDGRAALEALEKAPQAFQVVVTDEVMPVLTGTELARRVRRVRPDLPVVLVSGYSGPILTEQALGAGVSELLKKPVQSRELAAALARILHRPA